MNGFFWVLFCIAAFLAGTQVFGQNAGRILSVAEMQQDIVFMKNGLKQFHPALYWYISPEDFELRISGLLDSLSEEKQEMAFYQLINPLIADIHCGHTGLELSGDYLKKNAKEASFFPYQLQFVEGKAFVSQCHMEWDCAEKGLQIHSINHEPMVELIRRMLPHIYADGNNQSFKFHELNKWFWLYYHRFIDQPSEFTVITSRMGEASSDTFQVAAIPAREIVDWNLLAPKLSLEIFSPQVLQQGLQKWLTGPLVAAQSDTATLMVGQESITGQIAYLKVSSFHHGEIRAGKQSYKKFLKKSFRKIEQQAVGHLVLDLRNNMGGNDVYGARLYSYLTKNPFQYYQALEVRASTRQMLPWYVRPRFKVSQAVDGKYYFTGHPNLSVQKPAKNAYTGKLYVLVDGGSFSATSHFAAMVKHTGRGVFIGEETGGASQGNSSGFNIAIELPNSGIQLTIPAIRYHTAGAEEAIYGRGVIPDLEVYPCAEDWVKGIDTQLVRTLRYIWLGE
jgi:hypothetical protein